jgi:hypothetical protein
MDCSCTQKFPRLFLNPPALDFSTDAIIARTDSSIFSRWIFSAVRYFDHVIIPCAKFGTNHRVIKQPANLVRMSI